MTHRAACSTAACRRRAHSSGSTYIERLPALPPLSPLLLLLSRDLILLTGLGDM
jgi:hypothetical protein